MAAVSQGTTITWNSVALGEVVSVSVDGIAADSVELTPRNATSRQKVFSPTDVDLGTVTVSARGPVAMSSTNVGLTAALSIQGPSVTFSFAKAMFQSLGWQGSVGELQTYSVTFKMGA